MSGVSEAFVFAVEALSTSIPQRPFPTGLNKAVVGDWTLTLNASGEEIAMDDREPLSPWSLFAESNKYLAFAIVDPTGGAIGGMSETQFIDEMKTLAREQSPC